MKRIIFTSFLLVFILGSSCIAEEDFDTQLQTIVQPYLFSIARWESRTIPQEVKQWLFQVEERVDGEISVVTEYFAATMRIKTLGAEIAATSAGNSRNDPALLEAELQELQAQKIILQDTVERIIEKQVRDTLTRQSIFNPIIALRVSFPPVNFKLEKPPYLLVISPRERIESMREITLKTSLIPEEMEDIEGKVDELGVSSLVVGLGGLGATYPTLVNDEASLRSTIDTVAEEWLHQYLAFKPLGFLYLLDLTGLSRNYEIATMNESLAGMVSQEIGSMVYEKYYSEYENGATQNRPGEPEFDFNREMREIRQTVEAYLARGEIEQAEGFMEEKRQYLASMGYYIRKLNQAYFAFHGTYADKPAFISPIGLELRELRSQSASLKDFLNAAAGMASRQDLRDSIK